MPEPGGISFDNNPQEMLSNDSIEEKIPDNGIEQVLPTNNIVTNIEDNNNGCCSNWWWNTKKIVGSVGLLSAAVVLKTMQRVVQVAVTSIGDIDWNKVNPFHNWLEFGITPVQLIVSTQAMNLWKWGAKNIWNEGRALFGVTNNNEETMPLLPVANEMLIPELEYGCASKLKIMIKVFFAKNLYWISNHFMITASSMYSVGSLVSFNEYLNKITSWPNIVSTILRAEVLCYSSLLIDKGISYLGETSIWQAIKRWSQGRNWTYNYGNNNENDSLSPAAIYWRAKGMNVLKVVGCLVAMVSGTIIDNAIKTLAVMYTAGNISDFFSTFVNGWMVAIMFGLIINDTVGNKVLNVYAIKQIKKCWKTIACCGSRNELPAVMNSNDSTINATSIRDTLINHSFNDEIVNASNGLSNGNGSLANTTIRPHCSTR